MDHTVFYDTYLQIPNISQWLYLAILRESQVNKRVYFLLTNKFSVNSFRMSFRCVFLEWVYLYTHLNQVMIL